MFSIKRTSRLAVVGAAVSALMLPAAALAAGPDHSNEPQVRGPVVTVDGSQFQIRNQLGGEGHPVTVTLGQYTQVWFQKGHDFKPATSADIKPGLVVHAYGKWTVEGDIMDARKVALQMAPCGDKQPPRPDGTQPKAGEPKPCGDKPQPRPEPRPEPKPCDPVEEPMDMPAMGGECDKPVDDSDGRDEQRPQPKPPVFDPGFLNRVLKFEATLDGVDGAELAVTVEKFRELPKKYSKQDDKVVGEDALVLMGKHTKIRDQKGRKVSKRKLADLADRIEDITVTAKMLRPSQWQKDEDGMRVPTFRAKKVVVKVGPPVDDEPQPTDPVPPTES